MKVDIAKVIARKNDESIHEAEHSTRDSCCWITRQNWMAIRLAAHADRATPEEIVDGLITCYLATRPELTAAVKKYQESKAAAWKEAEKSTQPKAIPGA